MIGYDMMCALNDIKNDEMDWYPPIHKNKFFLAASHTQQDKVFLHPWKRSWVDL